MIEQLPHPFGVSLFEGVLARWLVGLSGRQYVIDEAALHGRPKPPVTDPGADASADASADGFEVDDRFPGLGRFGRLLEVGAGHLDVARAAHLEQCRQAGAQARALAAFAAARPAQLLDRPDDEVGAAAAASRAGRPSALTEVSEWAVDEVVVALSLSSRAATSLLTDSITLAERLPATLDALEAGVIAWPHARMLAEVVGPVKDEVRADVEARLLARAEGKTVAQLRQAARRAVLRADAAAAAKRLARALRARSVQLHPGSDGMADLTAVMSLPVARACWRALEAYAEDCRTPDDARTKDQRMTDCLVDLILRPGVNGPVQIGLTLIAGVDTMAGGNDPGEIDGHPVPADLVRELAHTLGLLPRPDDDGQGKDEQGEDAPGEDAQGEDAQGEDAPGEDAPGEVAQGEDAPAEQGGSEAADADRADPVDGTDANSQAHLHAPRRADSAAQLAYLLNLRSVAGTALTHLPRIAIVDEISGQLLALTDAVGIRHVSTCGHPRCRTGKRPCTHPPNGPGLGPPPTTPGYAPSGPLARFVRARDRRCRFPGCRAAAIRCDLDHNQPWPAGATSADNLCCLCRHHHRLSHQAPGWTMSRLPDGGVQWTTPGGQTITTHPIGFGTDDDLPPPREGPGSTVTEDPTSPPVERLTMLQQLRRWPPPPPDPEDEPPPF